MIDSVNEHGSDTKYYFLLFENNESSMSVKTFYEDRFKNNVKLEQIERK